MIDLVGFDGDDTLWRSQEFYDDAQAAFEGILGRYVDLTADGLRASLLATERGNIALFGYGAKGMALSMIESAIELTDGRIEARDIHRIVRLAKDVLSHPVDLLPGIREAVEAVAAHHRVVLITKGDLFHQEAKVARCGLADIFHRIEIVSEKDTATYTRLFREFELTPDRFAMVGNSLKSDIAPVVALGGWGVYMPYHSTWAHEMVADFAMGDRVIEVAGAEGIPAAIATMHGHAL
ncbi:putative hydrolase of the HAD superfamily [Luteibacter sp. 1214]|uniref:HAD family hydrolase n=1 Tax=Luteibacter sp. 1214 TaxID=2817735 RepID=UPI00285BE92C|nr:HAD family hydrolase [Luteibacter sp. 1214]MDR6642852.1 putative hydrolase of the HAD superfamily [Luteibacter sp. 1214]